MRNRNALLFVAAIAAMFVQPAQPQPSIRFDDRNKPPVLLRKVDPAYTDEARAARIEGSVRLSMTVGADGFAHDVKVLSDPAWGRDVVNFRVGRSEKDLVALNLVNEPAAGLGVKAIEAIQQWRFRPAMKDGEPIPIQAVVEVNFTLP